MTVQPTQDQLRAHLRHLIAAWDGPGNPSISVADLTHLHALLGQLDQAEARIKAVDAELLYADLHGNDQVWTHAIRRALEG